ncbi:uncharacterized protein LOC121404068 [Drosophila obscura]|uniref:uncharacterized protein LOC121404068 n=1 Tax=Drosophila obscura TaxID=7282 RepID=UPI001BB16721|nr:uncharacterized protein LOC121404068 [Drosophila obscura]
MYMANRSRLPQLQLPKFSGAYTEWSSLYSMFTAVIDSEADLTCIEKLQNLRSCLSGMALDTISSLEINQANYTTAHIKEVFGLERADSSVGQLRSITDSVTAHLRALEALATKEEIADCVIVHAVVQKLDRATQSKWEGSSNQDLWREIVCLSGQKMSYPGKC